MIGGQSQNARNTIELRPRLRDVVNSHKAYWDADPMDRIRNGFDEDKYSLHANPFPKGTPDHQQLEKGRSDALEDYIATA
jgi:hypothetical protein